MRELLTEVKISVQKEYERAANKFGKANNSPHESYAVILEEYDEAEFAANAFEEHLRYYWQEVKENKDTADRLKNMCEFAEHVAAEWIQVAAMCFKANK